MPEFRFDYFHLEKEDQCRCKNVTWVDGSIVHRVRCHEFPEDKRNVIRDRVASVVSCKHCGSMNIEPNLLQTLSSSYRFKDKAGNPHEHDGNEYRGELTCFDCGSKRNIVEKLLSCWCGWPEMWLEEHRPAVRSPGRPWTVTVDMGDAVINPRSIPLKET